MDRPDFFIVGAPKCGTTAMAAYLAAHPDIGITSPKEPHYFATDLGEYRWIDTPARYHALFSRMSDVKVRGEASVFYLYSEAAIPAIRRAYPDARLIVMLRDPVDLIHSLHSQLLFTRDEDIRDFRAAWEAVSDRRSGLRIPRRCRSGNILYYDAHGMLGLQLARLFEEFPADQVLITNLSDLGSQPRKVYRKVLSFLDIEDDGRSEFPRVNENKRNRSNLIAAAANDHPDWLTRAIRRSKSALGIERVGFTTWLNRANKKVQQRTPLEDSFRRELDDFFEQDQSLLRKTLSVNEGA